MLLTMITHDYSLQLPRNEMLHSSISGQAMSSQLAEKSTTFEMSRYFCLQKQFNNIFMGAGIYSVYMHTIQYCTVDRYSTCTTHYGLMRKKRNLLFVFFQHMYVVVVLFYTRCFFCCFSFFLKFFFF